MICSNCNKTIPDDSEFCVYCGNKIVIENRCKKCGAIILEDSNYCQYCGSPIENNEEKDSNKDKVNIASENTSQNKPKRSIFLPIVAGILGLLVIALSVVSILLKANNDSLKNQIITNRTEIEALNDEIEHTKDDYNTLKKTTVEYDSTIKNIKSFANRSYPGYSSDSFHSTKAIVFMNRNQTLSNAFEVVGKYNTTYHLQHDSKGIDAGWNGEFNASDKCAISVTAKYKGTATIRFTNDYNSEYFDVLIVVTDLK
ncbi:MAG: zinc-ribbon domain-containing protein [Oscillospiraceae bacterium]|nr:zinc-ribbon domain-containing protein [Oscillospiraceae bacterium]